MRLGTLGRIALAAGMGLGGWSCSTMPPPQDQPPQSADAMETFVVFIQEVADAALREHAEEIQAITRGALRSIQRVRVVSDATIAFESGTRVIPEIGLLGLAAGQRIKVIVDVSRPDWLDSLRRWLPSILAHELCHMIRTRIFIGSVDPTMPPPPDPKAMSVAAFMAWNRGRPPTLGDFVIHEGCADHFAMEVFGDGPYPWDSALEGEQLERWVGHVLEHWEDTDYEIPAWVGGSDEIPRQAAYAVGYRLVADYLAARPGVRPSQLMLESAATFRSSK